MLDLSHSPIAGDQWGGDDPGYAVISQLEIMSHIMCWNDIQVGSDIWGNVGYGTE